jgi:DNA-binding response OmpR family regulator
MPPKILVVDDNEMNRDMLARRLQRQQYDVDLATNGEEALQKVREQAYSLVLLDIMMPGMSGYEVLEKLKQDDQTKHIPVIMISAVDDLDSVVRCIEMGAEDYLFKPFNPVLLKARVGASLLKNNNVSSLDIQQLTQIVQQLKQTTAQLESDAVLIPSHPLFSLTEQLHQIVLSAQESHLGDTND